jgi:hypothetical protein
MYNTVHTEQLGLNGIKKNQIKQICTVQKSG